VDASQDVLIDLFGRIENFFRRLELYTEVRPTAAMMDIIVNIMIEVLTILGIATKEIKQGHTSELIPANSPHLAYHCEEKYMNKLLGKNDIESALKRLDTLTQEEARMATVEILKIVRGIDDEVNETKQVTQQNANNTNVIMQHTEQTASYVDEAKRSSPNLVSVSFRG